ncbi:uncharacterized protein GGS22DRAFT_183573 [Annulohypoxylon maeteangense]|uniref:uncharacterized protein n=1 Tax=Annulohypoxylon maeteangense TaxID=1927788 RepID=UPI002007B754|nr:uncharacterized protein GGS22DRAFT_183573 [Annulohypoxylon maeteangense]KAI0890228.1 hypothetical protein GGS22DRAFT_183573 [Annulohypoxylon maeteangense]
MKASTIFVSALAAFATAAPTSTIPEKRVNLDLGSFNNFGFNNQDLQYLLAINGFNLQAFAQLSAFNNLNIGGFQNLFVGNNFDINALLQLQQIALLSQLGGLGVFGNFDLSALQLNVFDLGLLGGIGGFDVSSLIQQSLVPQLQTVIQQTQINTVVL